MRGGFSFGSNSANETTELFHEVERLRASVDARVRALEEESQAMLAGFAARVAEAVESRIQLAAQEAMAFAEQGLQHHEAALRALGRRVAELSRQPLPIEALPLTAPAATAAYMMGVASVETRDCRRIDIRDGAEASLVADLANLPILPGGASKLVVSHVVEFASATALAQNVLPHWRSRLAPGGELVVVTLDGPAWVSDLLSLGNDFTRLRERLGADGLARPLRHLFAPEELSALLTGAGFAPEAATRAPGFDMRIAAKAA